MARNSIYFRPDTGAPITPQEAQRLGLNVSPEDLPASVPDVSATPVQQDIVTQAVQASRSPNTVEQQFGSFGNPFGYVQNLLSKGAENVGKGFSLAGEKIGNTLSGIGDWASENRVGLGGLGTAIGAGLAGRDASEALSRYNQSIIANKQQQAREEELRMLRDPTHSYNQQFRELFRKMIPDVAASLGENFEKMTVQNFKDAGLTDLMDVTQKRITISMSDPTSEASKRAREMATTQYGISIPNNVSANQVQAYIDAYNKQIEQGFKEREVSSKEKTAGAAEERAMTDAEYKKILGEKAIKDTDIDQQKLNLAVEEGKRKAELHQPELDKLKKQNLETQLKIDKDDPNSETSKMAYKSLVQSTKKMFEGKILGKSFNPESIPKNLSANEYSKLTDDIMRHRQSLLQMNNTKDIAAANRNMQKEMRRYAESQANYRASIQNKLGYSRLSEQQRHNREMEEYYKNKEANKYGDVFINEGDLKSRGLTPTTINKKIESAAGAMSLIDKSRQIITSLDKMGFKDIAGLTELSGVLKTLSTQIDLDEKQRSALGAYDKGVQELMDKMKSDPTGIKTLYARDRVKAQYQTMINEIMKGYKNQSRISGYDPRFGSPIQFTLELEDAIQNQNPESIQRFKDMGYDSDDMLEAYGKKFTVKKRGQ